MSGAVTESQYWDSCIFYALFKREEHRAGELDGIKDYYRRFEAGEVGIVTSALTIAEVVSGKLGDEQYQAFRDLRYAEHFEFKAVTPAIVDMASEIRDYYYRNPFSGDKDLFVSLGDAMHVATAIAAGVDVLVTTDSNDKPEKKEVALTRLSGRIADRYDLSIRRPIPPAQSDWVESSADE